MLKNKYLWIGIVFGLIAGDILGVSMFKKGSSADSGALVQATSTPYKVEVLNQTAGNTVLVSDARVATSTWLAVRESNGDLLGRILGARRIDAGEVQNLAVELLRPTEPHLMYAIVMYVDNGDNTFDNKVDQLVLENGNPVVYPFAVN